ncbi:hypothetical protein SBA3_1170020 [Candidatus Sulfopaludibacter sp. SbA3]|nr:hypothetical protein SBA3_1170020 [Candidatus Sulfopaludibacter sp. SbA3]
MILTNPPNSKADSLFAFADLSMRSGAEVMGGRLTTLRSPYITMQRSMLAECNEGANERWARAQDRILEVTRTVWAKPIAAAVQCRSPDRNYWN